MQTRFNPVTPISGKLAASQSSMFGKLLDTSELKCLNSEDLLKDLYTNVGTSLNKLLRNYSAGNILAVKNELVENYETLAVSIRNNSKPEYLYYEVMRLLLSKTLDGMNQSIKQYLEYVETISKLETCNNIKSILDDPVKLAEYIRQLRDRQYLFNVEPITAIKTILKPKYAEYIRLYGFPEGGIFKTEQMGDIIYKLQNDLPVTAIYDVL
jgi:hypothetical protein